ncbi:MarR family winged helix-turn-helix transcriptional regulator [Sedimentitalea nanhaiensis]|uniref:DNA-binding transcriptional regulator, MarR family n=1 Tax=Sedimentitalea nanhaiensis TaxID=999627 RepID=A0A1I7DDY1_9RHOB|nr:MarR family transcriptional regulator [Sedimentitalea nanhaiensis]SFU09815.1 DNA-binding transcriptional regulator, MarR family [Sedimentitalea nanhaiensis]
MSASDGLSRRRLRTWLRLLRIARRTENHLREFLRVNYDTTLPRFDVAAALYRVGKPVKMSKLSQMLLVSNGNATTVVDRLEKDGLVMREPSAEDKRVVHVSLTQTGRAWFKELADAHEAEVNMLFADLGHDDLSTIRDLMRRLKGEADDKHV